ncbi:hypothetical protein GXW83_06220 [Streptacidiphilus sp. PB12-B1b]|uniref:hypothetical protein n=1 Tax=Streptacidiphilus sp. PB12-B1b TaxID=2705012 RepID=UPI0015FAF7C0|nr:hypothetical protein [Streptacidiphilus sp. PB12-B1b]QMU75404.1 hypothetical protein GXW83_06220 [Streptacidiphilus sp. PB12-B1b]
MSTTSGTAAVAGAVLILCASSARAATPAGPAAPELSSLTVAQRVLGPQGGDITAPVPAGKVTLEVPAEALREPADVRLTTADAAGVDDLLAGEGFTAQRTVAAVGLKAYTLAGDPLDRPFARPLTLTVTGRSLGAPVEQVVQLNLASPRMLPAQLEPGSVSILTDGQPDLAVIAPKGVALHPRPGQGAVAARVDADAASMDGRTRAATVTNTGGRIGRPPSLPRLLGAVALSAGTALAVVLLHRRRPLPRV